MEQNYFVWECIKTGLGETNVWKTDIHAFTSIEDALILGLDNHTKCRLHKQHRIVCIVFNENHCFLYKRPVLYLLPTNNIGEENAPHR
jgi:hypothetical protein